MHHLGQRSLGLPCPRFRGPLITFNDRGLGVLSSQEQSVCNSRWHKHPPVAASSQLSFWGCLPERPHFPGKWTPLSMPGFCTRKEAGNQRKPWRQYAPTFRRGMQHVAAKRHVSQTPLVPSEPHPTSHTFTENSCKMRTQKACLCRLKGHPCVPGSRRRPSVHAAGWSYTHQ